jgi:hypothetical protein
VITGSVTFHKDKTCVDFDKTAVIANICTYCPCIIREAIEVAKCSHNLNHEGGERLSKA